MSPRLHTVQNTLPKPKVRSHETLQTFRLSSIQGWEYKLLVLNKRKLLTAWYEAVQYDNKRMVSISEAWHRHNNLNVTPTVKAFVMTKHLHILHRVVTVSGFHSIMSFGLYHSICHFTIIISITFIKFETWNDLVKWIVQTHVTILIMLCEHQTVLGQEWPPN